MKKRDATCANRRQFLLTSGLATSTVLLRTVFGGRVAAADADLPVSLAEGPRVMVASIGQLQTVQPMSFTYPPGAKYGEQLAGYYACADVFVFPSLTDTFGLVMLEAIASGTPVAAHPVTGPLDVLMPHVTGVMHQDLGEAIAQALGLERNTCREEALRLGWGSIADQFLHALVPINCDKLAAVNEAQWQNQAIPV